MQKIDVKCYVNWTPVCACLHRWKRGIHMGLIPQTKCSRCDRRYSGLRGRCPYCGARRSRKGKRVAQVDNSVWKLVIGIVLMVALIAAVVILLITTLGKGETPTPPENEPIAPPAANEGVSSLDNDPLPVKPVEPTEPDEDKDPEPVIQQITITYYGETREDITMKQGEVLELGYSTVPADLEEKAVWESSDEDVIVVLQNGKVTAIGQPGDNAILKVSLGDVSAECIIRIS